MGSGVISIGGLPELLRRWFLGIEKIRERLRENERLGNIRDSLGFPSGHRRDFIGQEVVGVMVTVAAVAEMRQNRGL
jgi:hypothetical protein